jgi:hypothetical protein
MTVIRSLDEFVMTTDPRLTVSFLWSYPPTDLGAVLGLIEKLRQKAIELGFRQVSELVCLATEQEMLASRYGQQPIQPEAAVSFSGALFDSEAIEFGLCKLPVLIDIGGTQIPYGVSEWTWNTVARTRDLRTLSDLFSCAAENGVWTSMTFGGTTFLCYRDASGTVKHEQELIELPDDS